MGSSLDLIDTFKEDMKKEFDMGDLRLRSYFLGMEVHQSNSEIFVCQPNYVRDMLKRFGLNDIKLVATPIACGEVLTLYDGSKKANEMEYKSIVGSLIFLCNTRPIFFFFVSQCSKYMAYPSKLHLKAIKRILRYVRGTIDYGIHYNQEK